MRILTTLAAVAILAIALAARGAAAQPLEGFFVSVDDQRLMAAGHIVPIFEYVEIAPGGGRIETGYLHLGQADVMLNVLAKASRHFGVPAANLGEISLAEGRRLALSGPLTVTADHLSWTAERLAKTSVEPGRPETPRASPFIRAATLADGGQAQLAYRLDGDRLTVWSEPPDGSHEYRRSDPDVLRMLGLIVYQQNISIIVHFPCLEPLAEALALGRPYDFDPAALAAWEAAEAAQGPDGAALAAEMEARGLLALAAGFFGAILEAEERAGALMDAFVAERHGGFAGYVATMDDDTFAVDADVQARLLAIRRLHVFDPPTGGETGNNWFLRLLDEQAARLEADPWSVTAPILHAMAGDTWVTALDALIAAELERTCPPG